jgi:hypothetical protein
MFIVHFHFSSLLDYKTVKRSAVLLVLILVVMLVLDFIIRFNDNLRIYFYVVPFFSHAIISVFLKKKESWLVGAIGGTLLTLILVVIAFFLFIK